MTNVGTQQDTQQEGHDCP